MNFREDKTQRKRPTWSITARSRWWTLKRRAERDWRLNEDRMEGKRYGEREGMGNWMEGWFSLFVIRRKTLSNSTLVHWFSAMIKSDTKVTRVYVICNLPAPSGVWAALWCGWSFSWAPMSLPKISKSFNLVCCRIRCFCFWSEERKDKRFEFWSFGNANILYAEWRFVDIRSTNIGKNNRLVLTLGLVSVSKCVGSYC